MIAGVTVCVGYDGFLRESLPIWKSGLDDVIVVTSIRDSKTLALCHACGVKCHRTDVFYYNGAAFNKAAAMEEGIAKLKPTDWLLCFDADVVPPERWRELLPELKVGTLYGAMRHRSTGTPIRDAELAGFFQLFNVNDPAVESKPLFGSWMNAGSYDSAFIGRWTIWNRVILPVSLMHRGEVAMNWCGVGNTTGMVAMINERMKRGGWAHERLDTVQ